MGQGESESRDRANREREQEEKRENKRQRHLYRLEVGMVSARLGPGRCGCEWTPGINASGDWWSAQFKPIGH